MRLLSLVAPAIYFQLAAASPVQHVLQQAQASASRELHTQQFGFYEWCIASKAAFLESFKTGGTSDWVLVMGNEAAGQSEQIRMFSQQGLEFLVYFQTPIQWYHR